MDNVKIDALSHILCVLYYNFVHTVTIGRNQKASMGIEEIEYGGTKQIAKMIQRYDMKKTYYVRGSVS